MTIPPARAGKAQEARKRVPRVNVTFSLLCAAVGLPRPVPEYRFHETRKWRFDWAFVEQKVAVEQEGAVFVNGRHTRGVGVIKDMEKYNAAAAAGWKVFRGTPQQIADGSLIPMLEQVLR